IFQEAAKSDISRTYPPLPTRGPYSFSRLSFFLCLFRSFPAEDRRCFVAALAVVAPVFGRVRLRDLRGADALVGAEFLFGAVRIFGDSVARELLAVAGPLFGVPSFGDSLDLGSHACADRCAVVPSLEHGS